MELLNESKFKTNIFDYQSEKQWVYKGSLPAIIDFYADWCGPCKALSPVLQELATEYKGRLQFYKVDTEKSQELASVFNIRSIPSILFIPMNGLPTMAAGFVPKEELKKAINDILHVPDKLILEVR